MTAEALLQLLGSAGLAAVLVAIINAVVNRRKLGAEATKMISDAAAGAVKDARDDNVRLRAENSEFRARILALEERQEEREGEWEVERREWRRVLQVHAAWDQLAIERIAGREPPIDLPDAPPLTPPTRYRRVR
jgi:hypothetical protein